jgi:hypothetical protein
MAVSTVPLVKDEGTFRYFLEGLDRQFADIGYARTRLEYAQRMGEPFDPGERARLDAAADALYTAENHEVIRRWGNEVDDPFLKRWATLLDQDFTVARLEQTPALRQLVHTIGDRYRDWRPMLDGQVLAYTEQTRIMRHEADRSRRQRAWSALAPLGEELASITREMFALRNELAKVEGFVTYADLRLKYSGIDRGWLMDRVAQMEETTAPTYNDYLNEQADKYGIQDVQPWDIQFLFDQDPWPDPAYFPADQMIPNLFACAEALGEDTQHMNIRVYWYDSPYGGQCMNYGPNDVRILTNRGDGMIYYHTAYHEYGHAIHSWYNRVPYTMQRESSMFSEGMAQLMALFVHYPSWLRKTGVPEAVITTYRNTRKLPWMYRHRRIIADVAAELATWDDPGHDFDESYGQSTARYLGVGYQPRPFAATPRWTSPMRMHSYFIADLIAAQTHAYLRREFAPVFGSNDALAHVRRHYWATGNSSPWLERVEACTGEPLTYHYLGLEMTEPLPDA